MPPSWFVLSTASPLCPRTWASARTETCLGPRSGTCRAGGGWCASCPRSRHLDGLALGLDLRPKLPGAGSGLPSAPRAGKPSYWFPSRSCRPARRFPRGALPGTKSSPGDPPFLALFVGVVELEPTEKRSESRCVSLTCRNEFKYFQRMTTTSSAKGNGIFK